MSVYYGSCDYCENDAWQYKGGEYVCREHASKPFEDDDDE